MLPIVWSLLPDNDWWTLPVFLCKLNPIKAHWGTGSWPFSFEIGHLSSPSRSCLGRFILICGRQGWGVLQAEPPHSSLTGTWIDKIRYIHTMEYYSSIERNEALIHAMMLINPEHTILHERNETQWPYIAWFHWYEMSKKGVSIDTESTLARDGQ